MATAKKPTDSQLRKQVVEASKDKTDKQNRLCLKKMVRNFYDIQRLRLQAGGRTLKRADHAPIQLHEVDLAIIERRTEQLYFAEKAAFKDIEWYLKTIPFYNDVLNDGKRYKGLGPTMAAVILGEFDIEREDTVSKMWRFAGLAPVPANRCKKCHVVLDDKLDHPKSKRNHNRGMDDNAPISVPVTCDLRGKTLNENQVYASGRIERPEKGKKRPYNAWLRAKMTGVLATSLLRACSYHCPVCDVKCVRKKDSKDETGELIKVDPKHPTWLHPSVENGESCKLSGYEIGEEEIVRHDSPFRKFYDDYKHRKETQGWGMSPKHRHNAALRYMVKMLLLDIWKEWRAYLDLPVRPSYHEEKQGGHGFQSDTHPALAKYAG